jgi:hypothetical protein
MRCGEFVVAYLTPSFNGRNGWIERARSAPFSAQVEKDDVRLLVAGSTSPTALPSSSFEAAWERPAAVMALLGLGGQHDYVGLYTSLDTPASMMECCAEVAPGVVKGTVLLRAPWRTGVYFVRYVCSDNGKGKAPIFVGSPVELKVQEPRLEMGDILLEVTPNQVKSLAPITINWSMREGAERTLASNLDYVGIYSVQDEDAKECQGIMMLNTADLKAGKGKSQVLGPRNPGKYHARYIASTKSASGKSICAGQSAAFEVFVNKP